MNLEQIPAGIKRTLQLALVVALHVGLVALVIHASSMTAPAIIQTRLELSAADVPSIQTQQPSDSSKPFPRPVPHAASQSESAIPTSLSTVTPSVVATETSSAIAPSPVSLKEDGSHEPVAQKSAPITAAYVDPNSLKKHYPETSRESNEEGTVQLSIKVSAKGDVESIQIAHSSGFPHLDEAARNAALQWRFIPARQGSETIASNVVLPVEFKLMNNKRTP